MDARQELHDLMHEISQDLYCAGWMAHLERDLWRMVRGGPREYGVGEVTEDQVARLRDLSEQAGGWWEWPAGTLRGPVFVPLAEWSSRDR